MTPIQTIGLAPNPRKTEAVELTRRLAGWLAERHVQVRVADEVAGMIGCPGLAESEDALASADLLVVLGGDGTLLRWNRLTAPRGTPMIGVNFGRYGFITEIAPESAEAALSSVLEGNYTISV